MIIGYTVPEIWHMTDVIVIFHFGLYFSLLPPNSAKNEDLKKIKKCLEKSSLNTSVPKIIITCYTVPDIWHVMDLFFILDYCLPFYPHNCLKN